jgi:hypothetical protein
MRRPSNRRASKDYDLEGDDILESIVSIVRYVLSHSSVSMISRRRQNVL